MTNSNNQPSKHRTVFSSTRARVAVCTLMMFALSACGKTTLPQDSLAPAGKYSRLVDNLWNPVFAIAVGVFILVQGLVLFIVIRFRRKSDDDAPKQVHGNMVMEIGWTIVPALILAVVGVFTVGAIFKLNKRPETANTVHVQVVGHRWWWEFKYKGVDITTANEMVIPINTDVDVNITSRDVIHSFWVPKLAGKQDAVPGRNSHLALEADQPGEYFGQCAEYCGFSHANMRIRVKAVSKADYQTWLAEQQQDAPAPVSASAENGQQIFLTRGCAGCHTINGLSKGAVGPNLTHLYSRDVFAGAMFDLNNANLRSWLRNPPAQKPGSVMPNLGLTEDEITDVMAYLQTLK